ncbi:MAG TPA: glycoside hydrolase family 3 N-terminal domain-containing protein [Solirubrobacter sp.]|nr:glycoside hydrolase family 3 N-terminal domain-containing protein [Solirubrobacter sp.]
MSARGEAGAERRRGGGAGAERRGGGAGAERRRGGAAARRRSRGAVVRRRQLALLAAAGAAFVAGVALGARGGEEPVRGGAVASLVPGDRPAPAPSPTATPAPVEALSLEQQVGKLVVLRFEGTSAPSYVRRVLHNGQAAGAILFRDNIASPTQLKALTKQLHRSGEAAGATPIVCTDQEGGAIRNVSWAPPAQPQSRQVPGRDARAAAKALRQAGINVSLAPVADVPSTPGSVMRSRAFSGDVARATRAATQGWLAGGVKPTAKHFPGLGGATVNTDFGSATVGDGAPTTADLAPFKAAIAAGTPLIMSSHARYPRLDAAHIASQSPRILKTLLRGQLHFTGVVMTDSIEAAAARATGSTEQIAIRSINAGNDIVLTTGQGSWIRVYRALLAKAKTDRAFRTRVKASAARVLALQGTFDQRS